MLFVYALLIGFAAGAKIDKKKNEKKRDHHHGKKIDKKSKILQIFQIILSWAQNRSFVTWLDFGGSNCGSGEATKNDDETQKTNWAAN